MSWPGTLAKPHSQWAWTKASKELKRQARADDAPCFLCGKRIDYDAPMRSPWSFTADHVVSLESGGPLVPEQGGLRPAHRRCNSRRGSGNRPVDAPAWNW
jgi:hypothetical protein